MSRIDLPLRRTVADRVTHENKVVDVTPGPVIEPEFHPETPSRRPTRDDESTALYAPERPDNRRSGIEVDSPVPAAAANSLANLAQVLYLHPAQPRSIAFVAAGRREGTTTCLTNLANYLAHQRSRVLMVDANLQSPGLHTIAGASDGPGLLQVLSGQVEAAKAIQSTAVANLFVLPNGESAPAGATHLIVPDTLRERVFNATLDFDFVLVDCAALNTSQDAAVTAATCDAALLVVEGGRTLREQAQAAKTLLMRADCSVLGVFMNKRKFYIPKFFYDRL
jgi:capsular exopolysaccharide synthesis family protein